jgi:hypothetical protein
MAVKLTNSQAESFELMHSSVCNALIYAEDLHLGKHIALRECLPPILTKLRWLKNAIELKVLASRRKEIRERDTLFFDEILRLVSNMDDEQKNLLEIEAKKILHGKCSIPE